MRFDTLLFLGSSILLPITGQSGASPSTATQEEPLDAARLVLPHVADARNDLQARQYSLVKEQLDQAQAILDVANSRTSSIKHNPSFIKTQACINYALFALEVNRPEIALADLDCATEYLNIARGTG
jgi:hypothetical protein